jgi:hypothetical protein
MSSADLAFIDWPWRRLDGCPSLALPRHWWKLGPHRPTSLSLPLRTAKLHSLLIQLHKCREKRAERGRTASPGDERELSVLNSMLLITFMRS